MKVTSVVSLMVLAQLATACQAAPPKPSGDEIVIASDLPTTAGADFAIPLQQAIELAIRQQGHIAGFKLVFMPLDDSLGSGPSAAKGVQNVNRMISDSRVLGMIGPINSKITYAEIPVANAANLVMLSPTGTDSCLTLPSPYCSKQPAVLRPGPNNYFRIAPPESLQGRAMARFAAGTLKVQRVAAFNEWSNEGELVIDSFKEELMRGGGTLLLRPALPSGKVDFTGFLAEARASGAQAIYAVTGNNDDRVCAAAAQANRAFPEGVYFLGTDPLVDGDHCIPDAVDNANGMVATLPDVDVTQSKDPAAQAVVGTYQKAFPKTSIGFNTYVGAAYDCARLLIDAISRAVQANAGRIPTRFQVLDALAHRQGFKGVTGTYSFDANGDAISPLMTVYKVENGKWVYVGPIDAAARPS